MAMQMNFSTDMYVFIRLAFGRAHELYYGYVCFHKVGLVAM